MVAKYLVPIGISLFESLCLLILFDTFLVPRFSKKKLLRTLIPAIVISVFATLLGLPLPAKDDAFYSVIRMVAYTILYYIILQIFYKGKIYYKLAIALFAHILLNFMDFFGALLLQTIGVWDIDQQQIMMIRVAYIFLIKIALFFVVVAIRMLYSKKQKYSGSSLIYIDARRWLVILLMPLLSMASIWTIFHLTPIENQTNSILLVISLGWVFMCLVVFYIVHAVSIREQEYRESAVTYEKIKSALEYANTEKRNVALFGTIKHDFRHHMGCIAELIAENKNDKALDYIRRIEGTIFTGIQRVNTNVELINAVLNEKMQVAFDKKIGINVLINDLSNIPFSDEDIVIIISNLLDNAIEACEKVDGIRNIYFKFVVDGSSEIVLSVRNTFDGKLSMHGGMLLTTKKEKHIHGIGFASVVRRVAKYDGVYAISHDDGEFQFTAIFPLRPKRINQE